MTTLGNIIWLLLGGIVIFFEYLIGGLILCLTIIGIPFGIQCFKLAFASLTPFGKRVVPIKNASDISLLLNIIWILFGGIWIALTHLAFGIACCITIIGIPFGIQHFKLMKLSFMPFGNDLT
jgi:uncharacterized membrane protein YccF (DUF307 family)